ncbi:hypothetical protein D3C76_1284390 [compost metagenome]
MVHVGILKLALNLLKSGKSPRLHQIPVGPDALVQLMEQNLCFGARYGRSGSLPRQPFLGNLPEHSADLLSLPGAILAQKRKP